MAGAREEPGSDHIEQASLRDALQDSAEDLYDNAPCGYLSTLPGGPIVKVNDTFLRMTGYTREELLGRRLGELLGAGDRVYYETHLRPMLHMQGWVREIAVVILRADGSRMSALINANSRRADSGSPAVVHFAVFDATERRAYEEELLRERARAREAEAQARVLAETLQASLIPPEPPDIPGLDVAAAYRPAGTGDTVGGDFYDVFETARGDWAIVVGDVTGKGAEAARVTAATRYTLRAAAVRSVRPRVILSTVNESLVVLGSERYCTVAFARVARTRAGRLRVTVCCAGHPPPVLVTAEGEVRGVGRPGSLLGAFEDPALKDASTEMGPGDVLVFYTDGVTEGRNARGEFFGEDGLRDVLKRHHTEAAAGITKLLVEAVVEFQEGDTRDDIAVVVLRFPTDQA